MQNAHVSYDHLIQVGLPSLHPPQSGPANRPHHDPGPQTAREEQRKQEAPSQHHDPTTSSFN